MRAFSNKELFDLLSKYRTEIMGMAALMIVLYHVFNWELMPEYSKYVFRFAHIGVDIFLFLSAIGLCYSLDKMSSGSGISLKQFYKKRLIRIFPAYFICVTLFAIINHTLFISYVLEVIGISYWLRPFCSIATVGYWYIMFIFVMYFLFPFLYMFIKGNQKQAIIISFIILEFILIALHYIWTDLYDFSSSRVLSFFLGAFLYLKRKDLPNLTYPLLFVSIFAYIGICVYSIITGGVYNVDKNFNQLCCFPLIAPGVTTIMAILFNFVYSKKILNKISYIFKWLGKLSLELYMSHLLYRRLFENINYGYYGRLFIGFCASILTAMTIHYLINFTVSKLSKK